MGATSISCPSSLLRLQAEEAEMVSNVVAAAAVFTVGAAGAAGAYFLWRIRNSISRAAFLANPQFYFQLLRTVGAKAAAGLGFVKHQAQAAMVYTVSLAKQADLRQKLAGVNTRGLVAGIDLVKRQATAVVAKLDGASVTAVALVVGGAVALVVGGAVGAYFLWPSAPVLAPAAAMMKAPGAGGFVISRAAFLANPQLYFQLLHTVGAKAAAGLGFVKHQAQAAMVSTVSLAKQADLHQKLAGVNTRGLVAGIDLVKWQATAVVDKCDGASVTAAALVVGGAVVAYFLWPSAPVLAPAAAMMKAPGAGGAFLISRAAFLANPQVYFQILRAAGAAAAAAVFV